MTTRTKPPLASPDDIEAQFYEAMQRGDIDRMMAVWSDDDDIVCVHPSGGRLVGTAAIRASFEAIFRHGAVQAQPERVRRLQTHACAVHSVLECVRAGAEADARRGYALATNVYVKTAMGWRMVVHHASAAASRDDIDTADAPSTLH